MKENDIVLAICEYLSFKGYFFWRQNTTPVFDKTRGKFRRMPAFSMTGIPDIILIVDGRFIGLECKMPKKYPSPNQKEFGRMLEEAGGVYAVVRSIEDLEEVLDGLKNQNQQRSQPQA